jgi:uncharacterized protein YlzI (FlbEa/FlbD family)
MPKFITLTNLTGKPILVNVNHIVTITQHPSFTQVTLADKSYLHVQESPSEVITRAVVES